MATFTPAYIKQTVSAVEREIVTSARWNELWNLSIIASDNNTAALNDLINTGKVKPFHYTDQEERLVDTETKIVPLEETAEDYKTFKETQEEYNIKTTGDITKNTSAIDQLNIDITDLESHVIRTDAEVPYIPTEDAQPTSKKYVDDAISQMAMEGIPDNSVTISKLAPDAQTSTVFNRLNLLRTETRDIDILDTVPLWSEDIVLPTEGWEQVTEGDFTEYIHPDGYRIKASSAREAHPVIDMLDPDTEKYFMFSPLEMNGGTIELWVDYEHNILLTNNIIDYSLAGDNAPTNVNITTEKVDNKLHITYTVEGTVNPDLSGIINSLTISVQHYTPATYKIHTLKTLYYSTDPYMELTTKPGQQLLYRGPHDVDLTDVEYIYINGALLQDSLPLEEDVLYQAYYNPDNMVLEPMVYEEKPDRRDGYNIQFGTATGTADAAWDHITFEYPFATTPTVTITPVGDTYDVRPSVHIANVTNTGFDYKVTTPDIASYSGYVSSASSWTSVAKTMVTGLTNSPVAYTINYIAIEKNI